jgi:hypothetical protein
MTARILFDSVDWKPGSTGNPYLTADVLSKILLEEIQTGAWVCGSDGPVNLIEYEPHANEPFISFAHVEQTARQRPCAKCSGSGIYTSELPCETCNGTGRVS